LYRLRTSDLNSGFDEHILKHCQWRTQDFILGHKFNSDYIYLRGWELVARAVLSLWGRLQCMAMWGVWIPIYPLGYATVYCNRNWWV